MRLKLLPSIFALVLTTLLIQPATNAATPTKALTPQQAMDMADATLAQDKADDRLRATALAMRSVAKGNEGDYRGALADARRAEFLAPDYAPAMMAKAAAWAQLGRDALALEDLAIAAKSDPEYYRKNHGPLLRAVCMVRLQRPDRQAERVLDEATQKEPGDPRLWLLLGRARLDLGDGPGALKALNQAVQLDPGLPQALFWRARLWREQPGTPDTSAKQALADIDAFVESNPSNAHGLGLRADILATQNEYRRSLRDVRTALQSLGASPAEQRSMFLLEQLFWDLDLANKPLISINVAETAGLVDRPEFAPAAEALYTSALAFDPKNGYALTRRGRARLYQGRVLAAADDLGKARSLGQQTVLNGMLLARALRQAHPPGRKALPVLNEILADNPENTDALILRAEIKLNMGDAMAAIEDLKKALHIDPVSAQAALLMAQALDTLGRPDQALRILDASLAIHAGRCDIQKARGRLLMDSGQYQKAVEAFSGVLQSMPKSAGTRLNRARAYKMLGLTAEARADLDKATR